MGITVRHQFHRLLGGGVKRHRLIGLVAFRKRDCLIGAVDGGGRCQHQVLDIKASGKLQHVERAKEIGIDIGAGIFKAVTHTRLGGEMNDDFRLGGVGRALQRILILEHADLRPEAVGAGKNGVTLFLEADIVIFRHAVEAGDEMTSIEQTLGDVKADKACCAGDQITHDDFPNPLVRLRLNRNAENLLMKLRWRRLQASLSEPLSCGRPTAA